MAELFPVQVGLTLPVTVVMGGQQVMLVLRLSLALAQLAAVVGAGGPLVRLVR